MSNIPFRAENSREPYPRHLLAAVRRDLDRYPAVALMGARQVGKTTLVRDLGRERGLAYCTLDDRETRTRALEDPEGLLAEVAGTGAVFDEVQRAPDLLLAVKEVVDREQRLGQFILTGSNQPRVASGVADSLQGRVAYRTLRPLTLREQRYEETPARWSWFFDLKEAELSDRLNEAQALSGPLEWAAITATGGMPRALAAPREAQSDILAQYLQTFAQRDAREVLGSELPDQFEQFVRLAAARTGQELNASNLARDLGVAPNTVQRWVGALKQCYLATTVPAYSRNATVRIIKAPKLFLVDSGLAFVGSGESAPTGWHFEALILNDLHTWQDEEPGRHLSHWRKQSGPEVDFILHQGNRTVAVEVKTAEHVDRHDVRHLALFLREHEETVGGVLLSADPEIRMIGERIVAAPWWAVL